MCSSERRIRSAYPSYKGEMEKYFSIFPLVDVERRGREGGRGGLMKTELISLLATWAKDAGIAIVGLTCRVNGCVSA